MEEEGINYKTLRKIQQTEKASPTLTAINQSFYIDLSEYLKNLEDRLEKESNSQKKMLLRDEIQNTKKIVTNIYEQREKKVLLAAISKARGGDPNLKNLVDEEKKLFDSTLQTMNETREKLLNKKTENIEKPSKETAKTKEKKEEQTNTNPIVMVTNDIPEFIGTDANKYVLKKGDVLSLPEDMSETLSKRGMVKEVKK
jgi:DNA replication initiation complex subunit (GINS family)